jgi:hypothetical protein
MSNYNQTPQEEANELYVGYWYLTNDSRIAKQCALIAVDKLIKAFEFQRFEFGDDYNTTYSHYIKVKQEIENYEQQ